MLRFSSIAFHLAAFVCLALPSAALAAAPDPFLCYEATRKAVGERAVSAVDQFGDSTITVRQAKRLCAPANTGSDPTAPSHAGHLSFYTIKQTKPSFQALQALSVRDQFGTLSLDLVRPARLLVPTSKSLQAPAPPPLATPLDHYKCYRLRKQPRLRVPDVTVETQFGPLTVQIKRPLDLCVPVDKNGEGIVDPSRSLMCYQVRAAKQSTRHVYTTDQFGSADYDLTSVRDLCVPLLAGPGRCGDGKVNDPGERCESGNDAACPGLCDALTCTCNPNPTVSGTPANTATSSPNPATTASATTTITATTTAASTATPTASSVPTNSATQGACAVNGTPCNDGNACTTVDTCQGGTCVGSSPVVCSASDQCHNAGTCNPTTGTCSNPVKANGAICNDGNACSTTDLCQSGICLGSNPRVCTASDQCHNAGTCNPATGACSNPAKANGAVCHDANACTTTDTCQAGTCTGSNPITCPATQCRNAGTCDPATGTCSGAKPNGTTCNDSSLCTVNDHCENGTCTGDSSCPSCFEECRNICDPTTGSCELGTTPFGTPCGDPPADECSLPRMCADGACLTNWMPDGTPCDTGIDPQCGQPSTCQDGRCAYQGRLPDDSPCDDGNSCTLSDTCQAGRCVGRQRSCDDRQALNFDTCNPTSGLCEHTPDPTRNCSVCLPPTRCCRAADGAGGFALMCTAFTNACEDETGVIGALCGTSTPRFVCPQNTNCCGDDCCDRSTEKCFQGQCIPSSAEECGNIYCRAGEMCQAPGVCVAACGAAQVQCGADQICCPAIGNGKCCGQGQACGATACEEACGPDEVLMQGHCCHVANACGARCCDGNTEICDSCGGDQCVPKP